MKKNESLALSKLKEFELMNSELISGGLTNITWIGTVSPDGHSFVDSMDTNTKVETCNFYTYDKNTKLGNQFTVSRSNTNLLS